jgi:hypothetical protein
MANALQAIASKAAKALWTKRKKSNQ